MDNPIPAQFEKKARLIACSELTCTCNEYRHTNQCDNLTALISAALSLAYEEGRKSGGERILLDEKAWKDFTDALDAPPKYNEAMAKLLREPSIFESGESASADQDSLTEPFVPCAMENSEAKITEMVLEDCMLVWSEWGTEGVELGYNISGELKAISIPALVATNELKAKSAQSQIEEERSDDEVSATRQKVSLTHKNEDTNG